MLPGERRVRHNQGTIANGWLDDTAVMLESLLVMRRAGADLILTYSPSRSQPCWENELRA
jgi:delta-aminolevulinic acid dehydratase/porphobilinogen synthase